MPTHAETRVLPYTPAQLYALVADVERYPEFLPWCLAARVTRRDGDQIWADLTVGYRFVRERFSSRVVLEPGRRITVDYLGGPMRDLSNVWEFAPAPGGGCAVGFRIAFAFRSRVFQRVAGAVFERAYARMVRAFEDRAAALYGAPASSASASAARR